MFSLPLNTSKVYVRCVLTVTVVGDLRVLSDHILLMANKDFDKRKLIFLTDTVNDQSFVKYQSF